jgi:hypothetical protein
MHSCKRGFLAAILFIVALAIAGASVPKSYNQFMEVDEFVKAHRTPHTLVSVEGYIVLASRAANGTIRIYITDSVDHVMSAKDALSLAKGGAAGIIIPHDAKVHPGWALSSAKLNRYAMYIQSGKSIKMAHDTVTRVRITGSVFKGRGIINPVTKMEYTDENGDWKTM